MEQKKKLAMVISTFSIGGGQKVVLDLLKAIDKTRFDVKLFVHSAPVENKFTNALKRLGVLVKFVPRKDRFSLVSYRKLSKALCEYNPDVVHIHLDTLYAPLWAIFHKKKTIFTVHSQAHRAFSNKFYIKLHRFLSLHRDYTITGVSDIIAKETQEILNIDKKVVAINNPVEIKTFQEKAEKEIVEFVNVARFHKVKNHRLLIKAFSKLAKIKGNARLRIAGDGPLYEDCKNLANQLESTNYIEFLGNVEDIDGLLNGADVFVLSSDSEAMPISILEAMAHGLPIVATKVGGVPDVVSDNGLLVEKGDEDALCEAMLKMVDSMQLRAECAKKSYQNVQKFSVTNIVEEYQKLYS